MNEASNTKIPLPFQREVPAQTNLIIRSEVSLKFEFAKILMSLDYFQKSLTLYLPNLLILVFAVSLRLKPEELLSK